MPVSRSKVKVTRPINAHTHRPPYFPNGKAYELQTWCTDGGRRPASATGTRSKVKGQGHAAPIIDLFIHWLIHSLIPGPLIVTHIVRHIFRMARPTNFKLGVRMEDDDPHQPQALLAPKSKVKVARSRDQSEPPWPSVVPACVISGRRGHTVSAEPGGHTSYLFTILALYKIYWWNERMDGWMDESMNKWINESLNESVNE